VELAGVIFDLDGTLVDSNLDFAAIRRDMGLGPEPILEAMERLSPERRLECERILLRHERAGAARATPIHGAIEWLNHLDECGIPRAVFTRNSRAVVEVALERCALDFEHVFAREDAPPKPDPEAILRLCRSWGVQPRNVLVVGDYVYDLLAGRAAGAASALVTHGRTWDFAHLADYVWESLSEGLEAVKGWTRPA
jgi:HAD superfamily hydrolase (TIGR01549 family)